MNIVVQFNIYLSFISGGKDIGKYTEGQVDGIYTEVFSKYTEELI